jgi:hypothetical protein
MELKANISLFNPTFSLPMNPLHGVERRGGGGCGEAMIRGIHYMELKAHSSPSPNTTKKVGIHYMELKVKF